MTEIESQRKRIFFHLLAGNKINGIEALHLFGCMRLGARIYELKKLGVPIEDRPITLVAKNGKTKRVKEYWIAPEYHLAVDAAYAEGRLKI